MTDSRMWNGARQSAVVVLALRMLAGCSAPAPAPSSSSSRASASPAAAPVDAAAPAATLQTYADAMRIACDAPTGLDSESPSFHISVARFIARHVVNREVRAGFAGIAAQLPSEANASFDAMLGRADIPPTTCALRAFWPRHAAPDLALESDRPDAASSAVPSTGEVGIISGMGGSKKPDEASSAMPSTGEGFGVGHGRRRSKNP